MERQANVDFQKKDSTIPEENKSKKKIMATFYLPPELVNEVDQAWLQRWMNNKKAQKSHIVEEAVKAYFNSLFHPLSLKPKNNPSPSATRKNYPPKMFSMHRNHFFSFLIGLLQW